MIDGINQLPAPLFLPKGHYCPHLHDSLIFLRLKLYVDQVTSTLHHLRLLFLPLESMLKRHFLAQLCSIIKLFIDFSTFQSEKISEKIILKLDDNLITPIISLFEL